jgi:hypothetical protein
MSRVIHIAAAAKQLNRTLFNDTQFEGSVMATDAALEVVVRGNWSGVKLEKFSGYAVTWREAA